jgi:hypothetical protein
VVAREIARLRIKERENKTILPPNRISRCARGHFHGPACALPNIFLKVSPKEIPDSADEAVGITSNMATACNVLN